MNETTIAEIRRDFPYSLMRRAEAKRLFKRLGLSRWVLERWIQSPPGEQPIRKRIGNNNQFSYIRDVIIHYALGE